MFRVVVFLACLGGGSFSALPAVSGASQNVLILHDSSGPTGWVGGLHSRLLANLMGHFQLEPILQPVEQYTPGQMTNHHATFYFGTTFDNPLPAAFLTDAAQSDRPLCWFLYNLWQLDAAQPGAFTNLFGFRFDSIDAAGFEEIRYKGETFSKDPRDPDLGRTTVLDTHRVTVHAWAHDTDATNSIPYALRSGHFWYVADSPFSFLTEEDRYVILTDLLHDILEMPHPESHSALIRLEDITPDYPPQTFKDAVDVLAEESVPFLVSVIPVLEDPLGVFGSGEPRRVPLTEEPAMVQALQYALSQGGQLLLHGYTHQYLDLPNPVSGLSGDDYEFFRVQTDTNGQVTTFKPVPEDSMEWVHDRLARAREEVAFNGLSTVGWVTPHYTASPLDYQVMALEFERTMERVLYFDEEGHWASQFFPYPIHGDTYGQTVFPENLGHVSSGEGGRTVEDLLRAARKARVVRDGWAGAFFHPFLDLESLRDLVRGLKDLGYEFVPLTPDEPPSICSQTPPRNQEEGSPVELRVSTCGATPTAYQWFRDGLPVPEATNATLTLGSLNASTAGHYTVRVTNPFGTVTGRAISVRIVPTPRMESYQITNGQFRISFVAETGLNYFVDYQDFLRATSWTATFPVTGEGSLTNINAPLGGLNRRFYRLRVE